MIRYIIAGIISGLILYVGQYLAKISKGEINDYNKIFNFTLPIFLSITVFIVMFLSGINLIISLIFSLLAIFISDVNISTLVYIVGGVFLAYNLNEFLLATTIIHGFVLSSVKYKN